MILAIAIGLVLLFAARALVKRRAARSRPATATPIAHAPEAAEATLFFLDTYRRRREEYHGYPRESHSAS